MLDSLRIEGFRAFDRLEIPRLGRVNLLVGQNSVGKSTVLEAVRLWAAGDKLREVMAAILIEREEFSRTRVPSTVDTRLDWRRILYSSAVGPHHSTLSIGPATDTSRDQRVEVGGWLSTMGHPGWSDIASVSTPAPSPCVALPARGWSNQQMDAIWQAVALSPDEQRVLDAVRLIHPDVDALMFLDVQPFESNAHRPYGWSASRSAVVRRNGKRQPLKSLGDGIERLLQISLALVNARGGFLLLDEVENGIHYRVLPRLWHLIFKVAADLDVQVFAATHSWDGITAFQQAAADHPAEGVLIKLEKDENGARAKVFDEADLAVITQADIEVR